MQVQERKAASILSMRFEVSRKGEEANKVLDDTNGSEQGGADTEDSVGAQLIARQAIPHAKVEPNGHAHTVEEDEKPEEENGLLARLQRVIEWRRVCEVGVIVCDLGVWEEGRRVGRGGA